MKLLLLIPFQLEAVERITVSGLNKWAVMFWSWEQLWRQLWNFHAFCPHLIETECLDFFTGKRQVRSFSNFIIFVAYLLSLLASMLYGYLKQHITSLTSVPISEPMANFPTSILMADFCHISIQRNAAQETGGVLSSEVLHLQVAQAKVFLFPFATFHAPSAQISVYPRCGRRHPCL